MITEETVGIRSCHYGGTKFIKKFLVSTETEMDSINTGDLAQGSTVRIISKDEVFIFNEEANLWTQIGSGGGSSDVTIEQLEVFENGEYVAPRGKAYSPVKVNVLSEQKEIYIGENEPESPFAVLWIDTSAAPAVLTGITISGATTVTVGAQVVLTAIPIPSDASLTSASYQWSAVSGGSAVSLSGTSGGSCTVTGVSAGDAVIKCRATVGGMSYEATANVSVSAEPVAPTGIALSASTATVRVNKTYSLTASVVPSGATYTSATYVFSIDSGGEYVSIAQNGASCVVTGIAEGGAVVKCVGTVDGTVFAAVSCAITVVVGGLLPEDYTQLNYVQADGVDDYVDTGYAYGQAGSDVGVRVVFSCDDYSQETNKTIIAAYQGSWLKRFYIQSVLGRVFGGGQNLGTETTQYTIPADGYDNIYVFEMNFLSDKKKKAGTEESVSVLENYTPCSSIERNIIIYANNQQYDNLREFGNFRVFDLKISKGDEVVRHYIPCENPQGVVGFYETETDTFHGNSGTGELIGG